MNIRQVSVLLVFATAIPIAAADPWRYIDPDSKMLMGIQWKRMAAAPAGAQFRRQFSERMPVPQVAGILASLESVLIASPGAEPGSKAQPPVTMVVTGQFDLEAVKQSVTRKARRSVVQGVEIYTSTERSAGRMAIALVSPETLLLADLPTLVRALGASSSRSYSPLILRAREYDAEKEFWVVSDISPADITGGSLPVPLPVPATDFQGLDLGISLRDGMSIDLQMEMASADSAHQLRAEMERTIRLAAKEKARPEMAGIDRFVRIGQDEERVRITFELRADELAKRMKSFELSSSRRRSAPAPVAAVPEAAPPVSGSQKPVIWNLDN